MFHGNPTFTFQKHMLRLPSNRPAELCERDEVLVLLMFRVLFIFLVDFEVHHRGNSVEHFPKIFQPTGKR